MYAACFGLYLGHPQVSQYRNNKERYTKDLRGPFHTVTIFIISKHKIYRSKHVAYTVKVTN